MENYGDLDSAKKHIRDKCIKLYMLDRGIGSDVHVETYGESFYYEGWTYHDLYQSKTIATT